MTTQKAPAPNGDGKKTRGDGDALFFFGDDSGKNDLRRISDKTVKVIVKQKAGEKVKTYDVSALPANVKNALACAGLAARGKMFVSNHCEKPEDVLAVFDAFWADNSTGKFPSGKEGGPRGRSPAIPVEHYVEALKEYFAQLHTEGATYKDGPKKGKRVEKMSAEVYQQYLNALNALTAIERHNKYIKKWKEKPIYEAKFAQVRAKYRTAEDKAAADDIISL